MQCDKLGKSNILRRIESDQAIEKINIFSELEQLRDFMDTKISAKGLQLTANKKFYDQIGYNKKQNLIKTLDNDSSKSTQRGDYTFQKFKNHINQSENFSEKINLTLLSNSKSHPKTNTTYYTVNDYSNLGYSLVSNDLNNDGFDDLIIGAPVYSKQNLYQNGIVYVVLANQKTGSVPLHNLNLEKSANLVINPPKDTIRGRFGHSISILDLNLDGFNDLIIAAPSHGLHNISYEVLNFNCSFNTFFCLVTYYLIFYILKGRVYIYFGDSSFKYENPKLLITCKNVM